MKKNTAGLIDFSSNLDPEISEAIGAGRARQAARNMTPAQRRRAEKDAARNRRMLDLPTDLESQLEELAAEVSVSVSSLAVFLMAHALEEITADDLRALRVPIRSIARYEFTLPYGKKSKNKRVR